MKNCVPLSAMLLWTPQNTQAQPTSSSNCIITKEANVQHSQKTLQNLVHLTEGSE